MAYATRAPGQDQAALAARAEAGEAAAAIEALLRLGLVEQPKTEHALSLLSRLCAMLTRLARLHA